MEARMVLASDGARGLQHAGHGVPTEAQYPTGDHVLEGHERRHREALREKRYQRNQRWGKHGIRHGDLDEKRYGALLDRHDREGNFSCATIFRQSLPRILANN